MTQEDPNEPVIRDKRRIDPDTGALRPDFLSGIPGISDAVPGAAGPTMTPPITVGGPDDGAAEAKVAELTADLQRERADFANYRKRVARDEVVNRERAVINVLTGLLPVLDDIGRARDHGELVGGFKVVAESLEATLNKLGLQPFGVDGDPFDPNQHEALMHEYSAEVTEPTCVAVLQPGYRVGQQLVRPARVKVAEPEVGAAPPQEN